MSDMKYGYFQIAIFRKQRIILKRNTIHFKAKSWYYFRAVQTKFLKNLLLLCHENCHFFTSFTSFSSKCRFNNQIWITDSYLASKSTSKIIFTKKSNFVAQCNYCNYKVFFRRNNVKYDPFILKNLARDTLN